jgi:hypothetical protein
LRISLLSEALLLPVKALFAELSWLVLVELADCVKADVSPEALCVPVSCASNAMRAGFGADTAALRMGMKLSAK